MALGCQRANCQKVIAHVGEPEAVILGVVVMYQVVPEQRLEAPVCAAMPVACVQVCYSHSTKTVVLCALELGDGLDEGYWYNLVLWVRSGNSANPWWTHCTLVL